MPIVIAVLTLCAAFMAAEADSNIGGIECCGSS